jgi:hypothetical protein
MAGSLTYPNKVKDVYTKLVFFDDSTNTFKRDTGSIDTDLSAYMGHSGIDKTVDYLKFTSPSTLLTGNIFELVNGSGDAKFSVDVKGVVNLFNQTTTPTATEGGVYYKDGELFLGV